MTQEKTTLREFINKLEKLSENGKYDNIRVMTMNAMTLDGMALIPFTLKMR